VSVGLLVSLAVLSLSVLIQADRDGRSCEGAIVIEHLPSDEIVNTHDYPTYLLEFNVTDRVEVKGKWYYVKGTNDAIVVDTCNEKTQFKTFIAVYHSCDISSSGYHYDDLVHTEKCSIDVYGDQDKDYYVFVGGLRTTNESFNEGEMHVSFDKGETPSADVCDRAIEVDSMPFVSSESTVSSELVADKCQSSDVFPGIWYHLVGSGNSFTAHTCNDETDFDTVISVHSSCNFEEDTCVATNDDSCGRHSVVTFETEAGKDYYIFVTGSDKQRGPFVLSVLEVGFSGHGVCTDSVEVDSIPFTYHGSTKLVKSSYSHCQNKDRRGLWFHIKRVQTELLAMTCDDNVGFSDTAIDVFSDCSQTEQVGTQCVGTNDDYCGLNAAVVLPSKEDGYYIFVSGTSMEFEGQNFTLTIQNNKDQSNDRCWTATRVTSIPVDFSGNTKDFKETTTLHCGQHASRPRHGAWYSYINRGQSSRLIGISTCNTENKMSARIEIFSDCSSCQQASVFNATSQCSTVTFTAVPQRNYTIFVTAEDDAEDGFFHVDFYEDTPSPNQHCDGAREVASLPYYTAAYTSKSEASYSTCAGGKQWQGVWYRIKGTGKRIRAATVSGYTHFDTVLELHSDCPASGGQDTCLGYNDDSSHQGLEASLDWDSVDGTYYYLFVRGYEGAVGLFSLDVYEVAEPANGKCAVAQELQPMRPATGYTTYAPASDAKCVAGKPRTGVWFKFKNTQSTPVVLSTCDSATTFDTEIEVYTSCTDSGADGCVDHSHDFKCTQGTIISFDAQANVDYFVFVTGNRTDINQTGFFRLTYMTPRQNTTSGSSIIPPEPSPASVSELSSSSDHGMEIVEVLLVIFTVALLAVIIFTIVCCCYKRPSSSSSSSYFQLDVPDGLDTNQTSSSAYVPPESMTSTSDTQVPMKDI